ncbi:Rieske 2Fe-2S domain-containing protein [Actinomadura sp. LD22]|uniref:Rieske 2Fe-2S domain-containing protein n=1 Tax=Actinomadura physcomitrii TaxID=2650748 RepID=A0A6I4MHN1_9ACTN|nr:Rieske 2Fe-2S domain-containing protein [Actinomadura physcomitrii]MWA04095.1 Rieske 2Fe-2S domain-containing protein [Actinomadura physcomitrii]
MSMPHKMVRRLEQAEVLDKVAGPLSSAVQRAVRPRIIRNLLSGTYTGHALHPPLTDVAIGAWSMSTLLDAVGGPDTEYAADILAITGVAAAVPTAVTGLNDWADTLGAERRVGLVHAAANVMGLALYGASIAMRARGDRRAGKALGFAGYGVLGLSAYLGGHLAFAMGVNVNRTAWQEGPQDWTPVLDEGELPDSEHRTVEADGVRIMLYRADREIYALNATCTHMGGPLDEGTIADGCVTCPWHDSTFRLSDGGIVRGPASSPEPRFEVRVQDGRIEVRVPPAGAPARKAEGAHAGAGERMGRAARRRMARVS